MQLKQPKTYKNIYFDLDNTLWDFESNAEKTFHELFKKHIPEKIDLFDKFLSVYHPTNEKLWVLYRKGLINKDILRVKRFSDSLKQIGIYNEIIASQFGDDYISRSPYQKILFPHAIETLEYLKNKGYNIYLLTNGFKEVQVIKIAESNIKHYINGMITSEEAGYQKPHRKIFEYALKSVNAKKKESIMIGDDLNTDIAGAKKFGMDCIFFNPNGKRHDKKVTYEIDSLKTLQIIF